MTMGDRIHTLRKQKGLTLEYVGKMTGVAKSTVRKWECGDIVSIRSASLMKLADLLGTTSEYIVKGETDNVLFKNLEPMPEMKRVPVIGQLGQMSSGKSCFINALLADSVELDSRVQADFALRCVDDSMVNAHIFSGDLVFIRKQPDVENGEITAVVIDAEATLKRVYKYKNRIELRPENPLCPVLEFEGEEMERVQIIGKAVAFLGAVR